MKPTVVFTIAALTALTTGNAFAESVSVTARLTPQEQMKFEFADGSKHFVLAVRREGKAEGSGPFAGAKVTEFGWHDVNPPISGEPQGYLQITAENGDVAILRWSVKATFLKGEQGPMLFDNGVWELVSGTGNFKDKRGVGSVVIKPEGGPNLFTLEGEIGNRP